MQSLSTWSAIPPENCATELNNWIDNYAPGGDDLILCAVDADGDGVSDIAEQYGHVLYCLFGTEENCLYWDRCNGVPMNFYFDQGMVNYKFYCGMPSKENARAPILDKLPPERCE